MVTLNQLKKNRARKPNHKWAVALKGNPQKRGFIKKLLVTTPRKPNSAIRKICQIYLVTGRRVRAKIPGETLRPQKNSVILLRGKGMKDTPGLNYTVIRGALDCLGIYNKLRRRSIYGARNTDKIHVRRSMRKGN